MSGVMLDGMLLFVGVMLGVDVCVLSVFGDVILRVARFGTYIVGLVVCSAIAISSATEGPSGTILQLDTLYANRCIAALPILPLTINIGVNAGAADPGTFPDATMVSLAQLISDASTFSNVCSNAMLFT